MQNTTRYNFKEKEQKWQNFWKENNSFKVEKDTKKKNFIA